MWYNVCIYVELGPNLSIINEFVLEGETVGVGMAENYDDVWEFCTINHYKWQAKWNVYMLLPYARGPGSNLGSSPPIIWAPDPWLGGQSRADLLGKGPYTSLCGGKISPALSLRTSPGYACPLGPCWRQVAKMPPVLIKNSWWCVKDAYHSSRILIPNKTYLF